MVDAPCLSCAPRILKRPEHVDARDGNEVTPINVAALAHARISSLLPDHAITAQVWIVGTSMTRLSASDGRSENAKLGKREAD